MNIHDKNSLRKALITLAVCGAICLGINIGLTGWIRTPIVSPVSVAQPQVATTYLIHAPITLAGDSDSNWNFLLGGTGSSASDPKIISGYVFTANSSNSIYMHDTTKYLLITNCLFWANGTTGSSSESISMYNCSNVMIANNLFYEANASQYTLNDVGVWLYANNTNTTINGNTFMGLNSGIRSDTNSSNMTFGSNSFRTCAYGINFLGYGNANANITITDNSFTRLPVGVFIVSTQNVNLVYNTFYKCNTWLTGWGTLTGVDVQQHNSVVSLPQVSISASGNPVNGTPVSFFATITGGVSPFTYIWTFDGNHQSTNINATFTYPTTGTYNVTLTIYDAEGDTAIAALVVTVTAPTATSCPSNSGNGNTGTGNNSIPGYPVEIIAVLGVAGFALVVFRLRRKTACV